MANPLEGRATFERLARLSRAAKESTRVAAEDREARDAAIEEADEEGFLLREIARATEMSTSHVQRIVIAATTRRQFDRERPETD